MANLTQHLTSISPDLRSSPTPGRRLLALVLCSMLVVSSVLPGLALAGEPDSEGEGTAPTVEVPVPPDFDPGGEETGLEETPASGGGGGEEEAGAVEIEPEVDIAAPPPDEVTSAAAEAPIEVSPQPVPEPAGSPPEPAAVQQQASESVTSEPVANQSIVAPKQERVEHAASAGTASSEAPSPAEPAEQEVPVPSPQPVATPPHAPARSLGGEDIYVVRPGDCLWHIAASLLPGDADTQAIAGEVVRLWRLNEDRIGTGDPNLIYAGTELRLH